MLLNCTFHRMLTSTYPIPFTAKPLKSFKLSRSRGNVVVCAAKGPRPRYPRVWKTQKKIGTISKSAKLVECVKGLSNVKEEVYGALDSFIAWDLEFPLITVKKALTTLEREKDWKRIIQVTKWMLSKGQGRTMRSYLVLLNALVEDDRLDEAEELWTKIFTEKLESTPRTFFEKMVSVYYNKGMHDKLFEVFADMDELGIHPTASVVNMVGNVFQELGMIDKYRKLLKKYPPPKWEYLYVKGKRIKVRAKHLCQSGGENQGVLSESDTADEGVNEVEIASNLYIDQSMEASEAAMISGDPREVYEEAIEENNMNSTELCEEDETSSMEIDG